MSSVFEKDPQAWDDSMIMELYEESINNHEAKGSENTPNSNKNKKKGGKANNFNANPKRAKLTKEQLLTEGTYGAWVPVSTNTNTTTTPESSALASAHPDHDNRDKHVHFDSNTADNTVNNEEHLQVSF